MFEYKTFRMKKTSTIDDNQQPVQTSIFLKDFASEQLFKMEISLHLLHMNYHLMFSTVEKKVNAIVNDYGCIDWL